MSSLIREWFISALEQRFAQQEATVASGRGSKGSVVLSWGEESIMLSHRVWLRSTGKQGMRTLNPKSLNP